MKSHFRIALFALSLTLLAACSGGESPTPEGASTALPFEETFADADSCFNLNSGDTSDLRIENGELVLAMNTDFGLEWSTCENVPLDNFTLALDVYDDSSTDAFRFFGAQLRKGPVDGGPVENYVVRIGLGGDGPSACIGLVSNNQWEADLTQSPSGDSCWVEMDAPFNAGAWNHFEVTLDGPEISLSVNDVFVTSATDTRLTEGVFTIMFGTHEAEAAQFRVDNVRVTAPGE